MIPIGCLGKLPLHGDFVRCNADAPALRELDAWVADGVYASMKALGGAWEEAFAGAGAARFIARLEEHGAIVAGIIAPSSDRVGRKYPVLVFTILSAAIAPEELSVLPLALEPLFGLAGEIASERWRGKSLAEFKDEIACLRAPMEIAPSRARLEDFLATSTAASGLGEELRVRGDASRYTFFSNLLGLLGGDAPCRYVLRYPLAGGGEEVGFWIWFSHLVSGRTRLPSMVLWNAPGEASGGGLRMLWSELDPRFFTDLFWSDADAFRRGGKNSSVSNLTLDGSEREAYWTPTRDLLQPWFGTADRPLADWIRELPRILCR